MVNSSWYNTNAREYTADTMNADMSAIRGRFLGYLPKLCCRNTDTPYPVTSDALSISNVCFERSEKCIEMPGCITILDAGCGPGRDAKAFKELGYAVYAMDASQAMVEHCRIIIGDRVTLATFQEYTTEIKFDGIWACASLLHLEPEELKSVITKFAGFLKPGGVFFMSFKYGTEDYVKDGRYFNCQTEGSIAELLNSLNEVEIIENFITSDVREGRSGEKWVNVIARDV